MYHECAILKQCFNVGCFRRQQYHVVRRFNGNRIQKTYVALGSIRVIETRQHTECLRLRDSNRLWGSVEKRVAIENASFVCIFIWYICNFAGNINIRNVKCAQATWLVYDFTTYEWVLLWKCQSFDGEHVSTHRGLEPPAFGFMLTALLFEIPGPGHLLFHVLKHWLWQYRYFACKYMLCYPWNGAVYFDLRLWGMVFAKNMLWIYIGRTWSQWKESLCTCFRIHTGRVDNIVTQFLKRYSDN